MALYVLLVSCFAMAMMRFVNLDFMSLWTDEAISIYFAEDGIAEAWFGRMSDYNPPLYDIILFFFVKLFGISEMSVRVLSVLFGAAALALLVYYLWKWDRVLCWIAVILVGFSGYHFEYSREARPYVVLFFFALWSVLFLLKKLRTGERWHTKDLGLFTVLLVVTSYLHYSGMIFVSSLLLIMVLWRKQLRLGTSQLTGVMAGLGLCLLPWSGTLFQHAQQTPGWIEGYPPHLGLVLYRLIYFYIGSPALSVLVGALILLAAGVAIWRKSPLGQSLWFSLQLWLLPLVLTLVIVYQVAPVQFYERHFFAAVPGLMVSLLISFKVVLDFIRALGSQQRRLRSGLSAACAVVLLLYLYDFFKENRWTAPSRLDARSGARYILDKQLACGSIIDSKYPGALNLYLRLYGSTLKAHGPMTLDLNEIDGRKCKDLFVVASYHALPGEDVQHMLARSWAVKEKKEFSGLTIYWYQHRNDP